MKNIIGYVIAGIVGVCAGGAAGYIYGKKQAEETFEETTKAQKEHYEKIIADMKATESTEKSDDTACESEEKKEEETPTSESKEED